MKKKTKVIVTAIMTFLTVIFVYAVLFAGHIDIDVNADGIKAEALFVNTLKTSYTDIEKVELRKDLELGKRTFGFGNLRIEAGHFRNHEFGEYMLYAYTGCKTYIVITEKDNDVIVLNKSDVQGTKKLYDAIRKHSNLQLTCFL